MVDEELSNAKEFVITQLCNKDVDRDTSGLFHALYGQYK